MNKFLLIAIAVFINHLLLAVHDIFIVHIIQLVFTLIALAWSTYAFNSRSREEVQRYAFYNIITSAMAANTFNFAFKLFNPELSEKYWLLVPFVVGAVWITSSYLIRKKYNQIAIK